MKGKVKKRIRIRNWLAIHAHNRSRAGPHLDKKKHKNKYKCRKPPRIIVFLAVLTFVHVNLL